VECIFGHKREEVVGGFMTYSSRNVFRAIKSRRVRWAGQVARMGEMRCIQYFDWKM
jgi:hypothetical protein